MFRKAALTLMTTALLIGPASAENTKVPFALDWKFEGPRAAYFAAIDNGHFAAEGFDVGSKRVGPLN